MGAYLLQQPDEHTQNNNKNLHRKQEALRASPLQEKKKNLKKLTESSRPRRREDKATKTKETQNETHTHTPKHGLPIRRKEGEKQVQEEQDELREKVESKGLNLVPHPTNPTRASLLLRESDPKS
jgi:hypothetical protein